MWETFTESPVMPSYTVAFFVGQFVSRERTTPKGTRVRRSNRSINKKMAVLDMNKIDVHSMSLHYPCNGAT